MEKIYISQLVCYNLTTIATVLVEPGQGRKAAAIRLSFCVRWLFLSMTRKELSEILDNLYLEAGKAMKEKEIPVSAALLWNKNVF